MKSPEVNAALWAVATISEREAWAVGFRLEPDLSPYVLRFDGPSWSEVPVPPPVGRLDAIHAVASDDIWAVGQGDGSTLAVHFDGTQWAESPTPTPGIFAYFLGVTAAGTDDVWAVGDWEDDQLQLHPLMEHWDGSTWQIVPLPEDVFLGGAVSASGPSEVWAAGSDFFHFDGSEWTVVPGPSLEDPYFVEGIHAVAPGLAWAVGEVASHGGSGPDKPLALRWSGSKWRSVRVPDVSALLLGIDLRRGNHPVAVGYVEQPQYMGTYPTFAAQEERGEFVHVPSWNRPHAFSSILADVSVDPRSSTAWTVGSSLLESGELRPLIERPSCPE